MIKPRIKGLAKVVGVFFDLFQQPSNVLLTFCVRDREDKSYKKMVPVIIAITRFMVFLRFPVPRFADPWLK